MKTPTSDIIPRERLSAWQRWELGALSGAKVVASFNESATDTDADALARERAAAVEQGRAAGHAEGRALAVQEQARLVKLATALTRNVAEHDQQVADEVLDLAITLAHHIVGDAIAMRRDAVLPVVRSALRQLPHASQRIEITLNPADLAIVQDFLTAEALGERCHLVASTSIAAGGCRVETEQCEVDATVAARWKRLLASLGRTDDWLEPV